MAERLGLSMDQRKEMEAIGLAEQKQQIRLRADMRIARMDLRGLMQKASAPTSEIKAKVSEINKLQGRMLEQRVAFALKRNALLTDEQRAKREELRLKGPERGKGRRDWRGRGPGGPQGDGPEEDEN